MPRRKKNVFNSTETSVQIPLYIEEFDGIGWRKLRILNSQGFVLRHVYFIYGDLSSTSLSPETAVLRNPALILETKNQFETFKQYYERDLDFEAASVAALLDR